MLTRTVGSRLLVGGVDVVEDISASFLIEFNFDDSLESVDSDINDINASVPVHVSFNALLEHIDPGIDNISASLPVQFNVDVSLETLQPGIENISGRSMPVTVGFAVAQLQAAHTAVQELTTSMNVSYDIGVDVTGVVDNIHVVMPVQYVFGAELLTVGEGTSGMVWRTASGGYLRTPSGILRPNVQ